MNKFIFLVLFMTATCQAVEFDFEEMGILYDKGTMPSIDDFSKTLYGHLADPERSRIGNLYVQKLNNSIFVVPASPAPLTREIFIDPRPVTEDRTPVQQMESINAVVFYSPRYGNQVATWHYFRKIKISGEDHLVMRSITTNNKEFQRGCWKIKR